MALPTAAVLAAQLKADCQATGATGVSADFYLAIATRVIATIQMATVISSGVAPPGGGPVVSTSTAIT